MGKQLLDSRWRSGNSDYSRIGLEDISEWNSCFLRWERGLELWGWDGIKSSVSDVLSLACLVYIYVMMSSRVHQSRFQRKCISELDINLRTVGTYGIESHEIV